MGYTPKQVDEMTVWEFVCCFSAHDTGKSSSGGGDIDETKLRAMGIQGF